ncbi:MAG: winged helix-turn-helix domain-containing protein [Angustibacter sp.]
MPRLLVLEDDDGIRTSLALALDDEGYDVVECADAESALDAVRARGVDLMLVDIMLGGLDGFTFIRQVRPISGAPIIVVSARGGTADIVEALEAGADDYVTKPFVVTEISARLRALLRRPAAVTTPEDQLTGSSPPSSTLSTGVGRTGATPVSTTPPPAPPGTSYAGQPGTPVVDAASAAPRPQIVVLDGADGPLVLDVGAGTVWRGPDPVHLTVTEYRLLVELASPPGRVLSRRTLLHRVWDRGFFGDERIVDVHVRRLRTKIEQDPSAPRLVVTVRGLGYRLDLR